MNESSSGKNIIWVHGDCLSPNNPALTTYPGSPAIFVFDDKLLNEWGISLKRIAFIYECLLELPVIIRRGDVASELLRFAEENGGVRIVTTESPSPRFRQIMEEIESHLKVEVLTIEPLVRYSGEFDLKRFSRYWRVAEKYAFGAREQMNLWN